MAHLFISILNASDSGRGKKKDLTHVYSKHMGKKNVLSIYFYMLNNILIKKKKNSSKVGFGQKDKLWEIPNT